MATIRYTHGFNLLHQLVIGCGVIFFGGLKLTGLVITVLEPIWDSLASGLSTSIKTPIDWIAFMAIWGGCVYLLFNAIVIPLSPLPTWLYLKLCLFIPATWQDAKDTSFLFEGDDTGKWYPLTALRKVPRQLRREVLREFTEQVLHGKHRTTRLRPQSAPQSPPPSRPKIAPNLQADDPCITNARNVLGVNSQDSAENIKKAYRQQIKKYHPDLYAKSQPELQSFAHEKAMKLNEAYDTLIRSKNGVAN